MKLLPGLYQIAGPSCSHSLDASAYLLPSGGELFLVDCGTDLGYAQIWDNITKLGFDPRRVTRILGTHGHYDHLGAAARWKRETGAQLYLHRDDTAEVEAGDDNKTTAALLYGTVMEAVEVDMPLAEGQEYETDAGLLKVLHTPGHTIGSCCLSLDHQCGDRMLIAGDTLYGGFSSLIGSDEILWRKSLDKLKNQHFDYFTFGHCSPQLLCDADRRIVDLAQSFANYYNPWFKDFFRTYNY